MKKTIFIKTFVTNIIVLAFFTIFTAIFTINTVRQWHIDSLVKELKKMSTIMTPEVNRYLNSNPDALDPHIKKLGKQIDNRLTVVKNDGTVFADSLSDPSKMENQGSRPEVIEAQTKDFSYNIRFSTTQMKEMLYFASPLKHEGTIAGVLRFSVFVDDINMILTRLNNKIIMLIIVLFVLSLLFTLFFSKRISDPIKRIAEASKEIKEGNFNTKVYVRDTGEIGNLANNFNSMVAYQKKLFTDLKKHQHELETILSSINEGLAVIDSDGNIVLSNQNFYKNIGNTKEKCQDKRIWEIYRAPNLNETIKNVFKQGEDTSEIIQIDDLWYDCLSACEPQQLAG